MIATAQDIYSYFPFKKHKHRRLLPLVMGIATTFLTLTIAAFVFYAVIDQKDLQSNTPVANTTNEIPIPLDTPAPTLQNNNAATNNQWQIITVQKDNTIEQILPKLGVTREQLNTLSKTTPAASNALQHLGPGQELHVQTGADGKLLQLQYPLDPSQMLVLTSKEKTLTSTIVPLGLTPHELKVSGQLANSINDSLQKYAVPEKIRKELATVFSWQTEQNKNFLKDKGFTLLYQDFYSGNKEAKPGHIIAAMVTDNAGHHQIAIRYKNQQGEVNYYTPEGNSLRKTFERFPLKYTRVSSPFSPRGRWHPILHMLRPHLGVDLSAPRGTPVRAVADGIVRTRGYSGGYGNAVIIDHGRGYTTLYGHLWRFANTARAGKKIHQGDVLGFVGESGLATGPHLHYEFRVNGLHKDPILVKLPNGSPLNKRERKLFLVQAQQVLAKLEQKDNFNIAYVEKPKAENGMPDLS